MRVLLVAVMVVVLGQPASSQVYDPEYKKLDEPNAADLLPENTLRTKEKESYPGRANSTCVTEPNVEFVPSAQTMMSGRQIESLLSGNTILSADVDGVFAIFYNKDGSTVGWMPKKTSLGKPDWNVGKVWFDNDQYCRTWEYWNGRVETCWEVHKGGKRLGLQSFYFICGNGGVAGDQHVVLKGNALGVSYEGKSDRRGVLTQDEEKAAYFVEKYFGNYKFK
jgi:hypothetical protein